MRARPLYRFAVLSSAFALSAVLAACLGGTGTDTENGLTVVDGSNMPLGKVSIHVRPALATPDSAGADPVVGGSGSPVTDENGFVRFYTDRPGKYLVEGRRGDTVLFIDTLRASSQTQTLVVGPLKRLRGNIRLFSGYHTDTGLVFVRGTGLAAAVHSDGTYDLGWGPSEALEQFTVGLRYAASPTSRAVVKMSARSSAGLILTAQDWTKPTTKETVVPGDSILLYKASKSAQTKLCLEDNGVSVTPAFSLLGSIRKEIDVIRGTGVACDGRAGTRIETYSVNAAGQALGKIGDFVMPDTIAFGEALGGINTGYPASQRAILASCVRAAHEGTTYLTSVKNGEVRVEDVKRGQDCLSEKPQP